MPTEAELRALLRGDEPEGGALDADAIISKARSRRRPKRLAAGLAGGVLAIGAVGYTVPAIIGLGAGSLMSASDSVAGGAAENGEAYTLEAESHDDAPARNALTTAAELNACGAPVSGAIADPDGLVVSVAPIAPIEASAASARIETTVTLRNGGSAPVDASVPGSPVLTLAHDGTVVWHGVAAGGLEQLEGALEPGAWVDLRVAFDAVACDPARATAAEALAPGEYELTAALDVVVSDAGARVVAGPPTPVTLE